MNKHRIFAAVAACVIVLTFFGLVWSRSGEVFDRVPVLDGDLEYAVHMEELVPREEATALLVADGMIFLYYEDSGLVNAYTTEGEFQYGVQIADGNNGRGSIGYSGGRLYVKARVKGIFVFEGTELVQVEVLSQNPEEYGRLERIADAEDPVSDGTYTYYYIGETNQITRSGSGNPVETVVQLPRKDPNVELLALAVLILTACSTGWYSRMKHGTFRTKMGVVL